MRKNSYHAQFVLAAVVLSLLAGCMPMNESRIADLAQKRYQLLTEPIPESDGKSSSERNLKQEDLASEQVLHLSGREIYSTDPAQAYSGEYALMNQLFIGLTRYDTETNSFLPAMAESWETSADGLTWTFHLREGISWVTYDQDSDQVIEVKDDQGNPRFVTAEDFKAGILRVLDPAIYSGNAFMLYDIQGAMEFNFGTGLAENVGVSTSGESTLVIQLMRTNASLDAVAEMPVLSAVPSWVDNLEEPLLFSYGLYVVREKLEVDLISMVRNPFWPEEKDLLQPMLTEISFDTRPGMDALELFKAGELDALKLFPEEIPAAMADPQLSDNLRFTDGTCGFYLVFFNVDTGPLDTMKARHSIAAAIDREKIVDSLTAGTGVELFQYAPPFLRGSGEYQEEIGIAYEVETASETAEIIELYGFPLVLASADTGVYNELAALIEENLETNLALDVAVDPYPWVDYMNGVKNNYFNSGMYLLGYCLDYADAQNLWDRWQEGFFADVANARWSNQGFSDLLSQATMSEKLADREGLYHEAEEIIVNQETVIVPLFWRRDAWLVNPKLSAPDWLLYPQFENWAFLK
jgi:oligopeptide transport system substrate-binding protein